MEFVELELSKRIGSKFVELELSKLAGPSGFGPAWPDAGHNVEYEVEYEGLHLICFHCSRFGHRKDQCPEGLLIINPSAGVSQSSVTGFLHCPKEVFQISIPLAISP
ncbi:hypothetical protein RIF29_10725 [Crotalaria pallida]|uniref:CCHC-type domain-containing protein n=1 Tax=Crotalaria pallida TaxID=3830 RepID=A0AAN9FZ84_CROPI